jgi:hypothetical protein
MSTRCNVIIRSRRSQFILYRHGDGYPESMFEELKKLMLEKQKKYKSVVWYLVTDVVNDLIRNNGCDLTIGIHGDIEFLYVIDVDQQYVECVELAEKFYYGNEK